MIRRIRTSEPASDEFIEAVRWYEARRSGLGAEFFDAVATTVALIETTPEIGTTISTDGLTRRALVARFPYQSYQTQTNRNRDCGNCSSETASGILAEPQLSIISRYFHIAVAALKRRQVRCALLCPLEIVRQ